MSCSIFRGLTRVATPVAQPLVPASSIQPQLPAALDAVLDRAMAIPGHPMDLDDLKIIVLMVYWSIGLEPDALVLDELCDDADRVAH